MQGGSRAAGARGRSVDGGALPPFVPDAYQLLKARITFGLTTEYSDKHRLIIASLGVTGMVVSVVAWLGADTTSFVVAGVVWVVLMSLIPVLNVAGRRYKSQVRRPAGGRGVHAGDRPEGPPAVPAAGRTASWARQSLRRRGGHASSAVPPALTHGEVISEPARTNMRPVPAKLEP